MTMYVKYKYQPGCWIQIWLCIQIQIPPWLLNTNINPYVRYKYKYAPVYKYYPVWKIHIWKETSRNSQPTFPFFCLLQSDTLNNIVVSKTVCPFSYQPVQYFICQIWKGIGFGWPFNLLLYSRDRSNDQLEIQQNPAVWNTSKTYM